MEPNFAFGKLHGIIRRMIQNESCSSDIVFLCLYWWFQSNTESYLEVAYSVGMKCFTNLA